MSFTIYEELSQLTSEFTSIRQSGLKKWYPESLWKKAITIAEKLSIAEVCRAIHVHPAYFRKKISNFNTSEKTDSLTFLEIPQQFNESHKELSIIIESSSGHKLKIDGATTSCIIPLITEFLKERTSCCK